VVVEPVPTTEAAAPGGCAEVGIGLDLRALPTGSDQRDIQWYTQGQASDFEALAPAGVRVELFVASGGVSTFDARIFASSGSEALRHCRAMTEAFIPKAPGRPGSDESGGSVTSPCEPCAVDGRNVDDGRDEASPDHARADP
jgi:hypothetical protein